MLYIANDKEMIKCNLSWFLLLLYSWKSTSQENGTQQNVRQFSDLYVHISYSW